MSRALLGVPLELKLIGANLLITLVALLVLFAPVRPGTTLTTDAIVTVAALVAASIVNVIVVRLALRPVNDLAHVAWLVSQGLLGARVPESPATDHKLARLSETINHLLDEVVVERDMIARLTEERRSANVIDDILVQSLATVRVSRDKVQSLHCPDYVSAATLPVSSRAGF